MTDHVPETMQAAVYRGVNKICLEEVPVPRIRANELLVKVAVCGVCPTDLKKIQHGTLPPPRIFGHETAGTIVKIGARVRGFSLGQRVALHHHVPCLDCHFCRHRAFAQCQQYKRTGVTAGFEPAGGGFAEYVRVMPFVLPGVVKIPRRNELVEGAMLEPVNTVLKAVRRLNLLRGDRVLVVGQGPIGLMFSRLLTLEGMRVAATDLFEAKLQLAKAWGAVVTVNGCDPQLNKALDRFSGGKGLDAAIIAVPSNDVVRQALSLLRGSGRLLLFAHTKHGQETALDLATVCVEEKDLLGSYSSDFTLQREVAKLVFGRQMDVRQLITSRFGLSEISLAIELANRGAARSLKVVVDQSVMS